jgi:hypothetical protein
MWIMTSIVLLGVFCLYSIGSDIPVFTDRMWWAILRHLLIHPHEFPRCWLQHVHIPCTRVYIPTIVYVPWFMKSILIKSTSPCFQNRRPHGTLKQTWKSFGTQVTPQS